MAKFSFTNRALDDFIEIWDYTKIGVSIQPHKKWEICAVMDMIW